MTAIPPHSGRSCRHDALAVAVLALLPCLFFHEMVFGGMLLIMRDVVFDFMPWRRFIHDCIMSDGVLPLWNPYSSCGVPFVGYPELGLFYPLNFLLAPLSPVAGFRCFVVLHLFLAGLFTYGLMRQWIGSVLASLFAAVAFMFNGSLIARVEFLSLFSADVWLPGIVLFTHLSLRRPSVGRTLLLSAALSCLFLAGDPESFMWTCAAAGLYWAFFIVRVALFGRQSGQLGARLLTFPFALAFAMALSMVQLLPTLELIPLSVRAAGLGGPSRLGSLSWGHLKCFLLPRCFGHPGYGQFMPSTVFEFWQISFYVGWLPLLCALTGALTLLRLVPGIRGTRSDDPSALPKTAESADRCGRFEPDEAIRRPSDHDDGDRPQGPDPSRPQQTAVLYLAILAGLSLFYALGVHTPLYSLLYEHAPLMRSFRWPAKTMSVCVFALAALGGFGLNTFVRWCTARKSAATAVRWACLAIAALLFDLLLFNREIHTAGDPQLCLRTPTALRRLLPDLGTDRVWTRVHDAQQYLYAVTDSGMLSRARDCLIGDTGLPFRVSRAWGGGSLRLDRYCALRIAGDREHAQRVFDLLSVRYWAETKPCRDFIFKGFPPYVHYIENADRLPRAYLVPDALVEPDDARALKADLAQSFDPRRKVVVDRRPPRMAPGDVTGPIGQVRTFRTKVNQSLAVAAVEHDGVLVVTDVHYPGWRAYDNGQRRPLTRANTILRAVPLETGFHRVKFAYCPRSFKLGFLVSLLAATALVACPLALLIPGRRSRRP